ncbi:MAG: SLC13 family permease, partial [Planctomycetes bacterium]|nr:SLC13 family permease [Planctomycetota bacterium]
MLDSILSFGQDHWRQLYVAAATILALTLLVRGTATIDVIGIGIMFLLVAPGIVDLKSAISGFSDSTIVTLAGLYVIAEGLTRTGALEFVARATLRFSKGSPNRGLFLLCSIGAVISGFVSDTAVVLVLLPITIQLARELKVAPSRLLMPVAFCALLGGMLTLVGTSINLFVSGAAEKAGAAPLGLFTMTPIALAINVVGIAYLVLFAPKLLKSRSSVSAALNSVAPREYVTELVIGPTSPLIGKPYAEAFPGTSGPKLVFFVRDERMHWPPFVGGTLQKGDVVLLQGDVQQLTDLQAQLALKMVGNQRFDPASMNFIELAVSPRAHIVGNKIVDLHMQRDYDCNVVAILRQGHHIRERASELKLEPGDLLLVCGKDACVEKLRQSTDFFMLTGNDENLVLRQHARRALWVLAAVIGCFILSSSLDIVLPENLLKYAKTLLPLPLVSLGGAIAMVATGCLSARRAYRSIDWSILVFVVGALALGVATEKTDLARLCAEGMVKLLSGYGPLAVVSGFALLTTLLHQFIAPYALVVLLTPIAIWASKLMGGTDPTPYVLAIAFGGSNAFTCPIGHQVNLMVMGPGNYKYGDYLRFGIPLAVL